MRLLRMQYIFNLMKVNKSQTTNLMNGPLSEASEEEMFFERSQINENANLHPADLSGDQNEKDSFIGSLKDTSKSSNRLLTATTIIKTVIGAGILTIPFTLQKMGYVFGIIVFMVAVGVNQFGTMLLLKSKNLSHHSNYSTILYHIKANRLAKGIGSLIIFLGTSGVCIADLIIFKSSVRKIYIDVISDQNLLDQFYMSEYFLVLAMAVLEIPLVIIPKIEQLRFMGLIGVLGIVTFMLTFVLYYILSVVDTDFGNDPVGGMEMFPRDWYGVASTVPNILLSITFHNNFFPLFKGLRNSSDKRMASTSFFGVIFCVCAYLLIGILGYNYVGKSVKPNILASFDYQTMSRPFFYLLNSSFLISVFFSFPILFFSCRNNFIALVRLPTKKEPQTKSGWREQKEKDLSTYVVNEEYQARKRKAKMSFLGYTAIIFVIITGVALGVNDIQIVFNAIGAIVSASLSPLLPCFFYFRLIQLKNQPKRIQYYISILLFVVMTPYCIFSIVSLYTE